MGFTQRRQDAKKERMLLGAAVWLICGCAIAQDCVDNTCPLPGWRPERRAKARHDLSVRPYPPTARVIVQEGNATSFGSGTLVAINAKHGLLVTNWHVVRQAAGTITVVFPGGFSSPATVLKTDQDWDLAALLIWRPPAPVRPIVIARRRPAIGAVLTVAGFGSGVFRAAAGRLIQFVAPKRNLGYEMIEVGVACRGGDSGGPILNQQGELAGVLFGSANGRTVGSDCERVAKFLAEIQRKFANQPPKQQIASPDGANTNKQPAADRHAQECVQDRARLRNQLAELRAQLQQLAARPASSAKPGSDPISIDAIAAEVIARLPASVVSYDIVPRALPGR